MVDRHERKLAISKPLDRPRYENNPTDTITFICADKLFEQVKRKSNCGANLTVVLDGYIKYVLSKR